MNTKIKNSINTAFTESLINVFKKYRKRLFSTTLNIRILSPDKIGIDLMQNDRFNRELSIEEIYSQKFIGLRLSREGIKNFFYAVHHAFMLEKEFVKPERISLILYLSQKANCPCVGIMADQKPLKVLRVADVFEAMELGNELLN